MPAGQFCLEAKPENADLKILTSPFKQGPFLHPPTYLPCLPHTGLQHTTLSVTPLRNITPAHNPQQPQQSQEE